MNEVNKGDKIQASEINDIVRSLNRINTIRVGPSMIMKYFPGGVFLDALAGDKQNTVLVRLTDYSGIELSGCYNGYIQTGETSNPDTTVTATLSSTDITDGDGDDCYIANIGELGSNTWLLPAGYYIGIIVGNAADGNQIVAIQPPPQGTGRWKVLMILDNGTPIGSQGFDWPRFH